MGKTFFSIILYFCILLSAIKILKPVIEKQKNKDIELRKGKLKYRERLSKEVEKSAKKEVLFPTIIQKQVPKIKCKLYEFYAQ